MDWSPPDSSVHGIFQARILEWVAISYPKDTSTRMAVIKKSCLRLRMGEGVDCRQARRFFEGDGNALKLHRGDSCTIKQFTLKIIEPVFTMEGFYKVGPQNSSRKKQLWHYSVCAQSLSRVWLFVTPWTVARLAPLSMGFSRQECWSGLPFLLQGIFPTQGWNPGLLHCRQILFCLSHQGSRAMLKMRTWARLPGFQRPRLSLTIQAALSTRLDFPLLTSRVRSPDTHEFTAVLAVTPPFFLWARAPLTFCFSVTDQANPCLRVLPPVFVASPPEGICITGFLLASMAQLSIHGSDHQLTWSGETR